MKKALLTLLVLASTMMAVAQSMPGDKLQLNINTLDENGSKKLSQYIDSQRRNRSFVGVVGLAVLNTIVTQSASNTVSSIMDLTEVTERKKAAWGEMIENECYYEESLTYINELSDFYAKGSSNGALDPTDFSFNGFTVLAQHQGKDVLRFYSHVNTDDEGLNEIVSHSKFLLVLDSMYFYPYNCHLPNMAANDIYPEEGETYERAISFNFEDREDLTVSIDFTITSSWYNQAILLSQDVELGSFSVMIPIDPESLTDSVFVYKKGMPDRNPIDIVGSSFIVPRSYMPLAGGVPHWGTGAYNVTMTLTEECTITDELLADWKKDYRKLKKMKKNQSIWPSFNEFCVQEGTSLLRCTLETASSTALRQWEWINQ